jgi:hypothetical protein
VPLSRQRRKAEFTPQKSVKAVRVGNPRWLVPTMLFFFLAGLAWIVVYYLSQGRYPVGSVAWIPGASDTFVLGNWNLLVGFGLIAIGFILSTRWR